jgi:hypothetical protein
MAKTSSVYNKINELRVRYYAALAGKQSLWN